MQRQGNSWGRILLWLAAIGWIALLFFFSTQDSVDSGRLSRWLAGFLLDRLPWLSESPIAFETLLRKLAHFSIFGVEGFLLTLALMNTLARRPGAGALVSGACCALMAVLNEYSETFAAGRSCELRDMLIDFGGALLGLILAALAHRAARRRAQC